MTRLEVPVQLRWSDMDAYQHVNNVEMFRLLGGGVFGDMPPGMPVSQLAVIPGASHVSVRLRADLLVPIVTAFLDAPMPERD